MALGGSGFGGASFGSYLLRERLSHGSRIDVYRADHRDGHRGSVAVKVVLPRWRKDAEIRRSLANEWQVLQGLDEPLLPRVYRFGAIEGCPALAMSLLRGHTFRDIIDRGLRVEPVPLLARLAEALRILHGRAVYHGGLRPESCLLLSDRRVALTDFGEAGPLKATGFLRRMTSSFRRQSLDRSVVSNEHPYLAPEIVLGQRHSGASDAYAFGVIACELLTGQVPFAGVDHANRAVQRVDVSVACSGLDLAFRGLIERCLSPDRSERPRSGEELAAVLEPHLDCEALREMGL